MLLLLLSRALPPLMTVVSSASASADQDLIFDDMSDFELDADGDACWVQNYRRVQGQRVSLSYGSMMADGARYGYPRVREARVSHGSIMSDATGSTVDAGAVAADGSAA